MKKLRECLGGLLLLGGIIAPAAVWGASSTMKVGYSTGHMVLNLGLEIPIVIKGAIEIPAAEAARIAGSEITAIRVAVGNELSAQNNFIFVSTSLDGEPVYTQKVDKLSYGWNEIQLSTPFRVSGEGFFVGVRYESEGTVISLDGQEESDLANWINISEPGHEERGTWQHQEGGALNIFAIVSGDALPQNDIAIDRHGIRTYAGTTTGNPVELVLRNNGAATVESVDVTVTVDGQEAFATTVDGLSIPSGELGTVAVGDYRVDSNNIFDVEVEVTAVNGSADLRPADNSVTVRNVIARKDYTRRKVLLEHFSTMRCANCPSAHLIIDDALRYRDDIIHVVHHAGFGTDALTIPEAETYTWLYTNGKTGGNTYAPATALDRVNLSSFGATNGSSATPGPAFFPDIEYLGKLMDNRLGTAALVTVDIDNSYDAATREVKVRVSGTVPNGLPDRLAAADPRVTIMLTEDGLEGTQEGVDVPMDGPYIHDCVLRDVLTAEWGDALTFDGANYTTAEYTFTLPADWNPDNMRLVAFVSDYNKSDSNACQVFNAEEVMLKASAGITPAIAIADCGVRIADGIISLPEGTTANLYTASGIRVASASAGTTEISLAGFAPGVYVLTADAPAGRATLKVVKR